MKYTTLLFASILFLVSCNDSAPAEEPSTQNQVKEVETVQETETEIHQTNVVTPEFWDSFETDITIVFYYSKIESSPETVHTFKEKLVNGAVSNGYDFHEYHTDENMGMVQVDDNIFFNLTEYLWNNNEGFVLLKKGALVHVPATELNATTFEDKVVPFFQ